MQKCIAVQKGRDVKALIEVLDLMYLLQPRRPLHTQDEVEDERGRSE